ncbi:pyruvate ferredoxin/flavodoxin oxidoreductase [Nocardioides baekrokdamisoli]|uniref:Pyruvate ferredoxin/flavodoxin oxidoreductase n=1 Tax=Nocardioides baekrokdamisoli TaxID=1804624 RepID=A0A3G9IEI1_9ACTN|nr:indolepyruvate ferredoxin oxidoreductase family protein [Nocardioides baekrokdamisoli]BBH17317.1 pyruvate ferredoxin/flavodoxin oxidoreductase [Nocardioides baekrokdamisoli]
MATIPTVGPAPRDTAVEPIADYDLGRRFRVGSQPMLLTGVQALVRMMVEHRALDRRRGRHTASFVSGYQGSPLGGFDTLLNGMPDVLEDSAITFVPGLNEELAATAVWGSQSVIPGAAARYDGVTGFWYGKGPGFDRATDSFRHANMYGANADGGAVLLVGDDPASKSSTVPAVSERTASTLGIPVLFPRNAAEVVTLGMHAVEMSRASGCLVALKIVADVADGAWLVDYRASDIDPVLPEIEWNGKPWTYTQRQVIVRPDAIIGAEAEMVGPRTEMVKAYAAANGLNVIELDAPNATMGFVASGSCYDSLRQAFRDLGVSDDDLALGGIRILRLGMMSPIEPTIIETFADGLDTIVVVEDKTSFIETQIRDILYRTPNAPRIIGKKDAQGARFIPDDGELTSGRLLSPMRHLLQGRLTVTPPAPSRTPLPMLSTSRAAYFCSGCPHNRSTAIPEGSIGAGGIGCHVMVTTSQRQDSAVVGVTQMGGEGSQWIGQAPFTEVDHIFQNLGDGTFFHSGQLALQACVAAGVNITYKLLFNEVVAMTGAQDAEGALDVPHLTHKLAAEKVARIIVCSDEPTKYRKRDLAAGTVLWDRDRLDEAQRILREIPGVTVLIYDQHCAADARRQRKRGGIKERTKRIVINEAVCEGCGDCGVKSNCLSVQPVETEYGRKTQIEQTSCNTDYSCLDGECPSFVSIETAPKRRKKIRSKKRVIPTPPEVAPAAGEVRVTTTQNAFLVGVGGTGIVTVNQVLATAAVRAGYQAESLDQTGVSQKAGPVVGHLRFSGADLEPANRLTPGSADVFLGFDLLTLAEARNLAYGDASRTHTIVSTSRTATGAMVYDPAVQHPDEADLLDRVRSVSAALWDFDGLHAADAIFGNRLAANFLLVGAAYQAGALLLPAAAIEDAITINGTAVASNIAAFRWGRAAVAEPAAFAAAIAGRTPRPLPAPPASVAAASLPADVAEVVGRRAADLVAFQNEGLADSYVAVVERVATAEASLGVGTDLAQAVARNLFKLTAYKDEYEVARLITDPGFLADTEAAYPGATASFMLHPPVLAAMGRKKKIAFGPRSRPVLRTLAKMKGLRGTAFDPFGYAEVRKVERELRDHYLGLVTELTASLTADNHDRAVEIAGLPDMVRGYESVKLGNVERYRQALADHGVELGTLARS